MTYIVANRRGTFEARESRTTDDGPRSRTLATFRELDQPAIEKIIARAERPPSESELRDLALRAGAGVAGTPIDTATRATLRSLARGEEPSPRLRRLLLGALGGEGHPAEEWLGSSLTDRGEALRQLLLLTDALPVRRRSNEIGFPRLDSA
jgi:hypothetical protein